MRDFTRWVLPVMLCCSAPWTALAQSSTTMAVQPSRFVEYEYFAGDTNADGKVMALNSSATSYFTDHFSARAGIPIYFDRVPSTATKLEGLLSLSEPNALSTLKTDATGFKNFGQFVAAVHVSHNLGIPFSELQAKMTGSDAVSLGKAIQELKPDADAKNEAKKAGSQADNDVRDATS